MWNLSMPSGLTGRAEPLKRVWPLARPLLPQGGPLHTHPIAPGALQTEVPHSWFSA